MVSGSCRYIYPPSLHSHPRDYYYTHCTYLLITTLFLLQLQTLPSIYTFLFLRNHHHAKNHLQTPAIAHARAERRKRQVRDWKEREAREARQKRSERRLCRRGDVDCGGGNNNNTIKEAENNRGSGEVTMGRKVRFLEA